MIMQCRFVFLADVAIVNTALTTIPYNYLHIYRGKIHGSDADYIIAYAVSAGDGPWPQKTFFYATTGDQIR